MPSTKTGDTGEPRFEDGTVLSSIGAPSSNRQTFTNRFGIWAVNSNWGEGFFGWFLGLRAG